MPIPFMFMRSESHLPGQALGPGFLLCVLFGECSARIWARATSAAGRIAPPMLGSTVLSASSLQCNAGSVHSAREVLFLRRSLAIAGALTERTRSLSDGGYALVAEKKEWVMEANAS